MTTNGRELPFVIEANTKRACLRRYLSHHSEWVLEQVTTHGAVLFRGFRVGSEKEFEDAILGVSGMRAMSSYFLHWEDMRSVTEGTECVFSTNDLYKTGGSWFIDGVHTENYYNVDVPRFVSFFCKTPSWVGGETGLIDMREVYANLPAILQEHLERQTYEVRSFPVSAVADGYAVSLDTALRLCRQVGMEIREDGAKDVYAILFKPSVFDQAGSLSPALTVNVSLEIPGLPTAVVANFRHRYSGFRWLLHRFAWDHPRLVRFIRNWRHGSTAKASTTFDSDARVGSVFSTEDVQHVARSISQHYYPCSWQRGDVLIIDNTQIAHTGMPGHGPRLLRVLLTNPMSMDLSSGAKGRQTPVDDPNHVTLSTLLELSDPSVPRL